MNDLLILYSTTDGHTLKIAKFILELLVNDGCQVTLLNVENAGNIEIEKFSKVVIAASIRYGKFNKDLRYFVSRNAKRLNQKRTAFVSVNLVARKPDKNTAETNPYTRKYLRKIKWRPDLVCVVAGMLDYPRYGFFDRNIIRFIMKITGGPTDPSSTTEFTDWDKLRQFSGLI